MNERIQLLRSWMMENGVAAYIVPTADPHNDEYIPDHWQARRWLTGFDGSAGTAIVTLDEAALWTDSRYWLQAEEQLAGSGVVLMREGMEGVPSPIEWTRQRVRTEKGAPALISVELDMFTFAERKVWLDAGFRFHIVKEKKLSAFSNVWADRPALPEEPIDVQPDAFTGASVADKLERLRLYFASPAGEPESDRCVYLFNDLSDIAWLLNLRGRDIEYNPVFLAYLAYDSAKERFTLFTHYKTMTPSAREQMEEAGVRLEPYDALKRVYGGRRWGVDPEQTTVQLEMLQNAGALRNLLNGGTLINTRPNMAFGQSPIPTWRAVKTEAEQRGFREAMERDGVAMVRFLRWLDDRIEQGGGLSEIDIDHRLTALRAEEEGFEQLSFATIAAYGPHGAIVHYEATPDTNAELLPKGLILIDSGAQFDCGTTDITRTLALGPLTEEERRVYTLVLKGHLALQRLHFPDATNGLQLDLAARAPLWAEGYDFGHGTGHGVGSHLCVHEGPQQIRKNPRACTAVPFHAGMTITDEPGIYVEGRFGVRIENTLLVVPDQRTPFGTFLRFEPLTLCPYDLRPVVVEMLTPEEKAQINEYHALVRERLMPRLAEPADQSYLEWATRNI